MTDAMLVSSGIVLLTVVAIAWGGRFLQRVVTARVETNELQRSYFRAGHAHAGVLVILGLLVRVLLTFGDVPEWSEALSSGVLYAAILMPAGFFLSVIGRDPQEPNRLAWLIPIGGLSLVVGVAAAGTGLIIAGTS
ncbi:hypothetical protein [Halostreptopolyspora alba]|uniref:Uncharacterized protein n=1 Tax=Halostreptopolyspora alba TaxID=2487137 RepID=A0A3N0EDV3_9ACTN|nr:hypothetical protein EFW17_05600 [Nocardiopsaceae bacterium YIM 96095]